MAMFPHVYKKLEFDSGKDFTPVSLVARFQFGISSGPATQAVRQPELREKPITSTGIPLD